MNSVGSPFVDPSVQFLDDDGVPLASGTITFYLAGTSLGTPVASFADITLSTPNNNPLTLNAAGRAVIYLSPVNAGNEAIAYDYVLKDSTGATVRTVTNVTVPAPSASPNLTSAVVGYGASTTLTISGGSVTPTKNRHMLSPEGGAADNLDTIVTSGLPDGAVLILGNTNGAAAITVRSGIGNITLSGAASCVLDSTEDRIYLVRQGSSWIEVARSSTVAATVNTAACDGRLTLTTGTPVTTSDVTAATTVYFTPYVGNTIALYDGSSAWTLYTFSQLSIAVPATTDTMYDVFAYVSAGVVTLEVTAWSSLTTRATALTRQDGVYVKSGATTRRYLGSFSTTAVSGQTEDSATKRYLWNYYHRVARKLLKQETTDTWTYNTATYRQANGSTANQVVTVIGVAEDAIDLTVRANLNAGTGAGPAYVAIGRDSTTTPDADGLGYASWPGVSGANTVGLIAFLKTFPAVGRTAWVWLERGTGSGTDTWYGDNGTATLYQSGLAGVVWG